MPVKVEAFRCAHGCKKYFLSESYMRKHEEKCFYNPVHKGCGSCNDLNSSCIHRDHPTHTNRQGLKVECSQWTEHKGFEEYE